jgi:uncharacterized protein (DUF2235 family)
MGKPTFPSTGRNIVICSDGTGNDYARTPSNVLRLYQWIEQRGDEQVACYHPGVGTHPLPEGRTRIGRRIRHVRELAFGAGVIPNVVSLYTFLMHQYRERDRIYLFGFSRGAFTVRALAGMLHVCGLLRPEDAHLIPFAAGLYQTSEDRIIGERRRRGLPEKFGPTETEDHASLDIEAGDFKSLLSRPCTVHFLGIWDTVKAYGWLYPQSFPALRHNPAVDAVRHAAAVHERRALFQMTGWGDRTRDVKEVWFAGDHSDIGGGHPSGNSPLSDSTLRWMLGEATHAGLRLNREQRTHVGAMNGMLAPSTPHHDLYPDGYQFLDRGPRVELVNKEYPPDRLFRVLHSDGARKPADHDEGTDKLWFHKTLVERAASDPAHAPARLADGKEIVEEEDLEILWPTDPRS